MASKPLSENARVILDYLKTNYGKDMTYLDIADATGIPAKSVNGIVTSALQRRKLAERVEVEGIEKKVIRLTDAGLGYDPDAEVSEDAE